MPRKTTDAPEPDPEVIEGEAVEVKSAGNDADVIADLARERALTAVPQRQLILTNEDRMTVHGLITAQLGAQGLNVTPAEFDYFIRVCELRGVNPLFREAHFIKDGDGRITVQIGIDGFRKLAEDTHEYRGQTPAEWGPMYEGDQPEWVGKPGYVRVGVIRDGFDEPVFGEAWLEEDGQVGRNGAIGQWGKRPRTMLAKVAEARALRKAFPRSLSGLYSDDEVADPGPRLVGAGEGATVPPAGSLPAPTGATETPGTPAGGTWRPPEPPKAPEGSLQGPVQDAPDGVRVVKPESELARKYGVAGERQSKLEVVFKAGNRKHTAMLFGEALTLAVDALQLKSGEIVALTGGTVEEIIWQEGKPPRREVWGVSQVAVMRDGAWVSAIDVAPTLPLEEPAADPPAAPEPAAAEPDPTPAPTSEPSSPPSTPTSTAGSPETTSLTPAPTAAPPDDDLLQRTEGELTGRLDLTLTDPVEFGSHGGKAIAVLRTATAAGEVVKIVLGDEPEGELEAVLGSALTPTYEKGDKIAVAGLWKNGWVIASAIGRPA